MHGIAAYLINKVHFVVLRVDQGQLAFESSIIYEIFIYGKSFHLSLSKAKYRCISVILYM